MKLLTIVFNGAGYEFTHRDREYTAEDYFALRRKAKRLGYTHYTYRNEGWIYSFSNLGGRT